MECWPGAAQGVLTSIYVRRRRARKPIAVGRISAVCRRPRRLLAERSGAESDRLPRSRGSRDLPASSCIQSDRDSRLPDADLCSTAPTGACRSHVARVWGASACSASSRCDRIRCRDRDHGLTATVLPAVGVRSLRPDRFRIHTDSWTRAGSAPDRSGCWALRGDKLLEFTEADAMNLRAFRSSRRRERLARWRRRSRWSRKPGASAPADGICKGVESP